VRLHTRRGQLPPVPFVSACKTRVAGRAPELALSAATQLVSAPLTQTPASDEANISAPTPATACLSFDTDCEAAHSQVTHPVALDWRAPCPTEESGITSTSGAQRCTGGIASGWTARRRL